MEQPIVTTNEDRARSITMEEKLVNLSPNSFDAKSELKQVQKEQDDDPAN